MSRGALPLEDVSAAPVAWSGKLSELLPVLTREAMAKPHRWAFRQLRQGALVAVLMGPENRRILRIARPERPANDRARERWAIELATFHQHLGTGHWQRLPDEEEKGVAARFLELHQGEVEPGKGRCDRCQALVPFEPLWGKAQRCTTCAMRAGDDEARAIREVRANGGV